MSKTNKKSESNRRQWARAKKMMAEGERTDVGRCDSSQIGLRVVRRGDLDDYLCQRRGRRVRTLYKDGERRQKGDLPSAPTMLRPFRP